MADAGLALIFAFCSSARIFQMLTAGGGASSNGFAGVFFPLFAFSKVFSVGSAALSAGMEACDLLSHVDSDEVLGIEETSSSLVTVDEEEAPRSGDETLEVSTERATRARFESELWERVSRACSG